MNYFNRAMGRYGHRYTPYFKCVTMKLLGGVESSTAWQMHAWQIILSAWQMTRGY